MKKRNCVATKYKKCAKKKLQNRSCINIAAHFLFVSQYFRNGEVIQKLHINTNRTKQNVNL